MRAASLAVLFLFLFTACGGPATEDAGEQAAPEQPAAESAPGMSNQIRAAYRSEGIPYDPDDKAWKEIPAARIPLSPQGITPPNGGGSVAELGVRAAHDGENLAILLEWKDKNADREVGVATFRDAAAVGFPAVETDMLPSPFMGDEGHPVNIWQWTADFDANARGMSGFDERYPHTEGVWIFPQDPGVTRQVRAWRGTEPVMEFSAKGFGTLQRHDSQSVYGLSQHGDGTWRVVLRRQLSTGIPEDTLFRPGSATHIVLAVWNGSMNEVNGKKSLTMNWLPFELEPTMVAAATVAP